MNEDLAAVITQARQMINAHDFSGCEKLLRRAMSDYPDNAVPHNLMGILCEKQNDHVKAMKHFRAAWALDPTYKPALKNLDSFSQMFAIDKNFVFDESDLMPAAAQKAQG